MKPAKTSCRRPAQTFKTYRSYHISHRTSGQPKPGQSRSPLETRPVHHKAWTRPTHARKLPQSVQKQSARPPLQDPRKVSCLEDKRDRLQAAFYCGRAMARAFHTQAILHMSGSSRPKLAFCRQVLSLPAGHWISSSISCLSLELGERLCRPASENQ